MAGRLADGLAGDELTVLAFRAPRNAVAEAAAQTTKAPAARVLRVPALARWNQRWRVAAYNAVALAVALWKRPQVLLVTHIVAAPAARIVAGLLRRPYGLILHGQELGHRPRLMAWAVRHSAVTIAVSTYTRGEAVRHGAPAGRIVVINPGVDAPGPAPGASAELAKRPPVVLTVARMVDRYKGHDVMIDAIAELRDRLPEVRWVVVGDGPLRGEYEREVARRGLTGNVVFAGAVSDDQLAREYANARVFSMPSRLTPQGGGEGFGLVYLEAAARGLPVVAGNEGGAVDAVRHGRTGLLVDPRDAAAVAAALRWLLTDDEVAGAMSRAALDDAPERSWQGFSQAIRYRLAEAFSPPAAIDSPLVLAYNHTATVGGAERSLLTQLDADCSTGAIRGALAAPRGDLLDRASAAGLAVYEAPAMESSFRVSPLRLPGALLGVLTAGRRVARLARVSGAAVLHANSTRGGLVCGVARMFGGPPVITHVRDCLPDSVAGRATRAVLRRTSATVVANSRYTAGAFGRAPGGGAPKVVYNALDERFAAGEADPLAARELAAAIGLEPGDKLLCVIGQITPWKGQDQAIRALAAVRDRHPAARLAIAGSVKFAGDTTHDNLDFERQLHRLASRLGVTRDVIFTGELDDVRPLVELSELVLMPSWEEPFGRAAIEAMAVGRPVAVTDVGGAREFVEHRRNGVLVPPRDDIAWSDAVEELLGDGQLRDRLAAAGRADVRRRFERGGRETSLLPVYAAVVSVDVESIAAPAASHHAGRPRVAKR